MKPKNRVLFIHGFLENHNMWTHFVHELGKEYDCIAPDLPGCAPDSVPIISLREVAAALQKFLGQSCFVIGHSMGGYIALELCELFPEKIRGLCLFHSTAQADSPEKKTDRDRAAAAALANKPLYVRTAINSLFSENFRIQNQPLIENLVHDALKMPGKCMAAYIMAMKNRVEKTTLLKNRPFPLYYFLGDEDKRLPLSEMNLELALLPGAVAHVEEGTGHMGHFECAGRALAFIQRLLRADY